MKYFPAVILLLSHTAICQVQSDLGRFSVDYARGCAPLRIEVQELDDFGNISRQYRYEEGLPETFSQTHTYQTPGIYQIVQIVGVDVDPKTDTLMVEVLEPRSIDFEVLTCEDLSVSVTIVDDYYQSFEIAWGDGTSAQAQDNVPVSHEFTGTGQFSISARGFFQDGAPNCPSSDQTINIDAFQNNGRINAINLVQPCLDRVEATLEMDLDPLQRYTVAYSTDDGNTYLSAIDDFIGDSLIIRDIDISAQSQLICFRVNAVSPCSGTSFPGEEICIANPVVANASIDSARATYIGEDILLEFLDLGVPGYIGNRQIVGFESAPLDTLFPGYIDTDISPIREYRYEIAFEDECGNTLAPVATNAPFLRLREIDINLYEITWTDPVNGLLENPSIEFQVSDLSGSSIFSVFAPVQNQQYRLQEEQGRSQFARLVYTYPNAGLTILSNTVNLQFQFVGFIPEAFTPNGDGLNDQLQVFGLATNELMFRVYNRWGEIIATSRDPKNLWDGLVGSEKAPEGKYFYQLIFDNIEGEVTRQQGSFVLLRK